MPTDMNRAIDSVAYRNTVFDPLSTGIDFVGLGLSEALDNAVSVLGRLKAHDELTYKHSVGVANSILDFSRRLGLDEKTCAIYYIGGLVHDIGKLDVPAELLNKDGRLTRLEEKIIRSHAWSRVPELKDLFHEFPDIIIMSEYHHLRHPDPEEMPGFEEKYDNMSRDELSGVFYSTLDNNYKHEFIKGRSVPLCVQMIALTDVYDATIGSRSYKNGMGLVQCLNALKSGPADPALTDSFYEMQAENILGQCRTFNISALDMESLRAFQDNTVDPEYRNAIFTTLSKLADRSVLLTGDSGPTFDISYTQGDVLHNDGEHSIASNVIVSIDGHHLAEISDNGGDFCGHRDVLVNMETQENVDLILCGQEPELFSYNTAMAQDTDSLPIDIHDECLDI